MRASCCRLIETTVVIRSIFSKRVALYSAASLSCAYFTLSNVEYLKSKLDASKLTGAVDTAVMKV